MARPPDPRIVDPQNHRQRWVTFTVAAEYLSMPRPRLNEYFDEGRIKARLCGRRWKIHIDELLRFEAWLDGHRQAS